MFMKNLSVKSEQLRHCFAAVLCALTVFSMQACHHAVQPGLSNHIISSGGVAGNRGICPTTPWDTIVPLEALAPKPDPGEPLMTIEGIDQFIKANNITSIVGLLNHLPAHYRNNFSLVETTRATGQSSLTYPRIILFGSDGRFLANVGTKPDDPNFNLLDVAQLHHDTGEWEFSVFDFNQKTPRLSRNPDTCRECHGRQNMRPVWGTNLDWPGVFGDNIAAGLNGEALDDRHAEAMNAIMAGEGLSDRFEFLHWHPKKLRRGSFRRIANHVQGGELLLSNIAIGSAVARGAFIRIKHTYPKRYQLLREALLLSGYEKVQNTQFSSRDSAAISQTIKPFQRHGSDIDAILAVLGLDTKEAFSLSTLAERESPNTDWKMGSGDLYEQVLLQVLDDLARSDKTLSDMLANITPTSEIFNCPGLAKSVLDIIHYKMLHLYYLQGRARYEVNRVYYAADAEDIYTNVFAAASVDLIPYLRKKINNNK